MQVGAHKREFGLLSDVLIAVLCYLVVLEWHVGPHLTTWYVELVPVIVFVWWVLSASVRHDVPYRLGGVAIEFRDTLAINVAGGVLLLGLSLLTHNLTVSRLVLTGFPALSAAVSVLLRLAVRQVLAYRRSRGRDLRHVLVVGPAGAAARLLNTAIRPEAGLRPLGLLVPPGQAAAAGGPWSAEPAQAAAGTSRTARPRRRARGATAEALDGRFARAEAAAAEPVLEPRTADGRGRVHTVWDRGGLVHVAAGGGPTVLGTYDDLPAVLHEHAVDQIAVTAPLDDPGLRPVIDLAIAEGKTVWLVLDAFGSRLMGQGGAGHVVVLTPERNSYGLLFKRLFDIAVAAVCLAITSPVFAACAIAIKLDDPSAPAIFRQSRVGLHGRTFTCLKFRSMVPDAERRRQDLLARNEMDGPVFKIKDDPRITPVGRVLRKHSFDELPQLWNVLRGDMSLVGPRPPLPDEVREYQPEFRRRLTFRPGLTCLWQVSGRNRLDFGQWMRLDLEYVDNWSFWLDLAILLRTIPVVLFGSGM